jgi:hypothetical protein
MRKKISGFSLSAMLFALCLPAEAQQPGGDARIELNSPSAKSYCFWSSLGYLLREEIRDQFCCLVGLFHVRTVAGVGDDFQSVAIRN